MIDLRERYITQDSQNTSSKDRIAVEPLATLCSMQLQVRKRRHLLVLISKSGRVLLPRLTALYLC